MAVKCTTLQDAYMFTVCSFHDTMCDYAMICLRGDFILSNFSSNIMYY